MRMLPPVLAAGLASGVTTHCRCWLLTRPDGFALGLTDHDRDLVIDGRTFEAQGGFEASATEAGAGMAVTGGEVAGSLSSARILPEEIEAGLYDGAELRTYLVDWSAPALDGLIEVATLGEIRRLDGRFVAETRSALHAYDQARGRLFAAACDAELGDTRCGIGLGGPPYRLDGVIGETDGSLTLAVPALAGSATGLFTRGLLHFVSGANAGGTVLIKEHRAGGVLVLWQPLVRAMALGDSIAATAGCDKRFATCRDRFGNAANFRGFPHIPAPDFVLTYARTGEGRHLGRPLVA
jgi:uncharacterized phage protein (TIGR02218 family)